MRIDIGLVDHHLHGVVDRPLDRADLELLINEGGAAAPVGTSHFDSPVGLAIRMHCAPLLDLQPGIAPEDYLARRAELSSDELNRRFFAAAGLAALLVDTGHRSAEVLSAASMGKAAGVPSYPVARIEHIAEEVAASSDGPREWLERLGLALSKAAQESVGFKTIVAYRTGYDIDPTAPAGAEVAAASEGWFREGTGRLADPLLVRHVLHAALDAAAEAGIPVQAHAGFGDTDLTLHRADPSMFTPWVREFGARGVSLVFLHCYPYHRNASYLASVYPHVSFDVGCMFHYTGARSATVLAEALELAPWTKQLYSSDAFGLPEFVYLGAALFRRALASVLDAWIVAGDCTAAIADDVASALCAGNARNLYHLEPDGSS